MSPLEHDRTPHDDDKLIIDSYPTARLAPPPSPASRPEVTDDFQQQSRNNLRHAREVKRIAKLRKRDILLA